ncbi:MAG TPA: glycosyltransferase family 2 protein [bacterium]|jgi:glycosyltransferase involved in cell wall biosynthesis|nr:glycosyltransferase family 2 protein [bacterium]
MPAAISSSDDAFRACLVLPVYGHHASLGQQLPALRALGLTILLVDDGSGAECSAALRAMAGPDSPGAAIRLRRREKNGGKGAAVKDGLRWAADLGFTHAVQVDADGQHDLASLPRFLDASRREPGAVICAEPVFGPDAPPSRLRWRRLTNFWVAVNSLSGSIPDGMCGFRIYPLAGTLPFLGPTGDRMDFDPEILVRLVWAGLPLRFLPSAVRYPAGGISGFRSFEDNTRISWMHTRLFFGMLARSPRLLSRRLR